MKLNFKDKQGQTIEVGDLVLRDGWFLGLVDFRYGAYLLESVMWPEYLGDYPHIGLFYDNWKTYKNQGLEVIAKDIF